MTILALEGNFVIKTLWINIQGKIRTDQTHIRPYRAPAKRLWYLGY